MQGNDGQLAKVRPGDSSNRAAAIRSLIGSCIGMFFNPSSLLLLTFGVYMVAIANDTGWDKTAIASSVGPAMILVGLMPPLVGWLTNRWGPRRFVTFGFPLCGVGLMLLATATNMAMFSIMIVICGLLISFQVMVPYVYTVSGWFDERRGLALGLILASTGLGVAVIPPIAAQMIAVLGWRKTFVAMGALVVVIGIPVARWLMVDPPAVSKSNRQEVPGIPWRQALGTRTIWLLMGSIMLTGGAISAGTINLYVQLVDRGIPPVRASFIMSLLGISMICSRLVVGYLFDLVRAQRMAAVVCAIAGAAFATMAMTTGPLGVVIAALLLGIGFGAEGDALSYLTSRAFGMRDFGTIFGIVFLAFTIGGGLGPITFARLHGSTGDYQMGLWLATAACGIGTLLMLFIRDKDLPFARHSRSRRASPKAVVAAQA